MKLCEAGNGAPSSAPRSWLIEYRTKGARRRLQQGQCDLGIKRVRRDPIEHLRGLNVGEIGAEDVFLRSGDQGRRKGRDDHRPERTRRRARGPAPRVRPLRALETESRTRTRRRATPRHRRWSRRENPASGSAPRRSAAARGAGSRHPTPAATARAVLWPRRGDEREIFRAAERRDKSAGPRIRLSVRWLNSAFTASKPSAIAITGATSPTVSINENGIGSGAIVSKRRNRNGLCPMDSRIVVVENQARTSAIRKTSASITTMRMPLSWSAASLARTIPSPGKRRAATPHGAPRRSSGCRPR